MLEKKNTRQVYWKKKAQIMHENLYPYKKRLEKNNMLEG